MYFQAIPGVVAFFDHTAIPGKNSCVTYSTDEPIFSEGRIEYAGQVRYVSKYPFSHCALFLLSRQSV